MRYFIRLAYNGSNFHGWQSQPNAVSVQDTIEKALRIVTGESIAVTGAGRTDAGVHAVEMYAHIDLNNILIDKDRFIKSVNSLIGKYIAIYEIFPVENDAHARFDAIDRTYKYFISYNKNPFLSQYSAFSHKELDLNRMNEAASVLLDTTDFTSFAKLHSDSKTNICEVSYARWEKIEKKINLYENDIPFKGICFTIKANRFLRNMVRAIVGTLFEVGNNKISLTEFIDIIEKKDRCKAGVSMPAQGLFLWKITYPYIKDIHK